jgi:hypothetical protein
MKHVLEVMVESQITMFVGLAIFGYEFDVEK